MRKVVAISALSVLAAGAIAIGVQQLRSPHEAMTADLERDLSLATNVPQTRAGVVSALELGRQGAPSGTDKGQRAALPTKKRAPSAAPSRTVAEVSAAPADTAPEPATVATPDVGPTAVAAAPTSSSSAVDSYPPDLSYPTPTGGPSAGGTNDGDRGRNDGVRIRPTVRVGGDGAGLPPTTIIGAILRGGAAGHDNCEPAGRRNGLPAPVGVIGAIGGILAGGTGLPTGSVPGGPRPGGNRAGRW